MFKSFAEAIKAFFRSIFGNPDNSVETNRASSRERKPAQDGSEIDADTIVIAADEEEEIIISADDIEEGFEEDRFEDTGNNPEAPSFNPQRFLWCLDNGHGKLTAGKRSPVFDDGVTQFFEYEFNRDIVARIMKALDDRNIAFFNVVPEVDIDNFLEERVKRANNKASDIPKIFVSIHSNAAKARSSKHWTDSNASGIETWFFHGSQKGKKVASVFQRQIVQATGWRSRGLKSKPRDQFFVLSATRMPAVLTESGFYNNKQQGQELMKPTIRQQIADAHVAAILELEANGIR